MRILIAYARFSSDRNLDSGSQRQTGGKIERNKRKTLRKNERERKESEREQREKMRKRHKEEDQRGKREQGASPPAAAQARPGGRAATQPRPPSFLR